MFIGKHAIIIDAPNKSLVGLKGTIVDESKNTVTLKVDNDNKIVLKSGVTFSVDGKETQIPSKSMQERIKSR